MSSTTIINSPTTSQIVVGSNSEIITITSSGVVNTTGAAQDAIINNGYTISALYNSGLIEPGSFGVYALDGIETFVNSGTILSSAKFTTVVDENTSAFLTFVNSGLIEETATTSDAVLFGSGYALNTGSIISDGPIAFFERYPGTVENNGLIDGATTALYFVGGASTLILDPSSTIVGHISVYSNGTLDLEYGGTSTAEVTLASTMADVTGPGATSFGGFAVDAARTVLVTSAELSGTTIEGLVQGNTLDLSGVLATSGSYASGELTLYSAGNVALETISIAEPDFGPGDSFRLTADGHDGTNITEIACFTAGTRIATLHGEVAVEDLRPGNEVLTANGMRPIRWIGRIEVSTRFSHPLRVLPIRITAGALGDGLPLRDLLVSPDHAMFIDGILVQAGALENGGTIRREHDMPECFTYYHVELERHELLRAEGALTESFVDNIGRMHFQNWDAREAPETQIAEMAYPRAKSARQLRIALRARLGVKAA